MSSFDRFLAVVGYFRSSGYFKLREELGEIPEIKILIGINIDNIFKKHNKALLMLENEDKAREIFSTDFAEDIVDAHYSPEIERGILQMCEDLVSGRLQMRIHPSKNLHAKFYLCLPQSHTPNSDGWVIMGSSNISESGLGITTSPRYELNVAMKDYDDVNYCHEQFEMLWNESITITADDIEAYKKQTYLGYQPTPYELYIKVLIEAFGDQVEDDFTIQLPIGIKELKYQKDAAIQGYQMLLQHNGLFLSDVVGLGKTMIAAMIAQRFIEANGKNTNILVVFPPALEENWRNTFKLFGISKKAQYITNGSLKKILDGKDQYKDKEEFDLIIVDEAHGFRSDLSGKYDELQKICKAPCSNQGLLKSSRKKVMLLSATPLNNRPEDLLNQLLLFQDSQQCTIDGVPNLKAFFVPKISDYKKLMRERDKRDVTVDVEKIYASIRDEVIDKVTIRRTRNNILNDPDYCQDLEEQGIVFPHILPPNELTYILGESLNKKFYATLSALTDEENPEHVEYARYRAIEFLNPEFRDRYPRAKQISQSLAGIYKVHMVKRLESSFHAFKKSLATLLRITSDMIKMFEQDKVIIAPDLNVKALQAKDMELDEILELAMDKGYSKDDILYHASDFQPEFIEMLKKDRSILEKLNEEWAKVLDDPKLELFINSLQTKLLSPVINPTGKLVVFSESVDTIKFLYDYLTNTIGRKDVLLITASNRNKKKGQVKANFDANVSTEEQKNEFNIILTSDVLAEGVNLHRSNVIVNYDSPWNASRLMQRIGRVNRIGSVAPNIYNFMFYPSQQGDKEIQLYKNALIKLQSFHSAYGEDAQIYSREEIVKEFKLFDSNVKDNIDKKIALLRELRDLYNNDRELYHKIKALPLKSRVGRDIGKHQGKTIVFVSSEVKTEFYLVCAGNPEPIDFLTAVRYLKAQPDEQPASIPEDNSHYQQVNRALGKYRQTVIETHDEARVDVASLDKTAQVADKFLRTLSQVFRDPTIQANVRILRGYLGQGTYSQLPKALKALSQEYKNDRIKIRESEYRLQKAISGLVDEYHTDISSESVRKEISDPRIIISETFI